MYSRLLMNDDLAEDAKVYFSWKWGIEYEMKITLGFKYKSQVSNGRKYGNVVKAQFVAFRYIAITSFLSLSDTFI